MNRDVHVVFILTWPHMLTSFLSETKYFCPIFFIYFFSGALLSPKERIGCTLVTLV